MSQTATAAKSQMATLARELSEFLIEMSIGVHRNAMYPPGHPSLQPVVEKLLQRLAELFADRRTLSIGVASRQLVIEGVATDPKHPVLSDLAKRLHEHQLGAVSFESGVSIQEVSHLLETLAQESDREGTPIGLRGGDDFPRWEHIRLYRVGYEQLELQDADPNDDAGLMDRASELWLGLAQAAMATEGPVPLADADPSVIAQTIQAKKTDSAYDQVIVGYMLQLADELKGSGDSRSRKVRGQVSKLMNELDEPTLERLISFGGNQDQRKKFVLDANQSLAVDSVVKVLKAAAATEEQSISSSMTRMLTKLASHAEDGGSAVRTQADSALRENVEALIDGWELKDPNPEAYTTVLDAMATSAPEFTVDETPDDITGALRLVQMSLEVDAFGPTVQKAIRDVIEEGGTRELMELAQAAPDDNQVSRRIRGYLTTPSEFRRIMEEGHVDSDGIRALVDEMGATAVDPLLDVLAESDSRAVRRRVFDVLPTLGPFVARRAIERLEGSPWFVQRNMLALLHRVEHLPEGFDPQPYMDHDDARVRREALPVAIRPGSKLRDRALIMALGDSDERMVRMGLLEMQESVPASSVPTLVNRVIGSDQRSEEIRTLGVRCLENSSEPLARTGLLEVVASGKTLFGKVRVANKNNLVLEALRVLASKWAGDEAVELVLDAAMKSKDPDLRGAVRVGRAASS